MDTSLMDIHVGILFDFHLYIYATIKLGYNKPTN